MKINKKEYGFTKRQFLAFTLVILFVAVAVLSWATDLTPASSCNRNRHDYIGNWSDTDHSELYYNDEVYTRVEYTGNEVVIEEYDSSFKITSSKKIEEMPLNCYMGSYMGSTYNFLVYGLNRTVTLNMTTENTCCVVKYDKGWNKLGTYYYQSTAACIGAQDVTDFAENGDILYIEATETRSNGHEFSICLEFNSADNTLKTSSIGETRTHRMASYIMVDGDSLVTALHSDKSSRGIDITRTKFEHGSSDYGCTASIYLLSDYLTEGGNNFTGMTVGGLLATDNNYLVVYSNMKENYALGNARTTDASYIQLSIIAKDGIDRNIVKKGTTLLDAEKHVTIDLGTSSIYTICPYIVHWKDDKYVIMWGDNNRNVHYVIYSDDTQTVSEVTKLTNLSLSDATPLSVNGNIVWYTTGDVSTGKYNRDMVNEIKKESTPPTFYTFNPENGTYTFAGYDPADFVFEESTTSAESISVTNTEGDTVQPETSTQQSNEDSDSDDIDANQENTDYSKQISAAKKKKATISKVTNVKGRKIKVTIKKASGYKFQIKISTSKKFKKNVKTYETSKTTYTAKKKFSKGKTYYVKVRTYKTINGKTYYGKWSAVKKVKIKK